MTALISDEVISGPAVLKAFRDAYNEQAEMIGWNPTSKQDQDEALCQAAGAFAVARAVRAALQEPVEDRLLHPEELRRFLGIKTPALKRSLARLGIPVINVGGHVRVSERMLNDWIRESSRPLPWGKDHDDEAEDTQDET
jgi:hypothetical protein